MDFTIPRTRWKSKYTIFGSFIRLTMFFRLTFLWLAIPWLQAELDLFAHRFNTSRRRNDKHKVTPQGIPDLIAKRPELYGARDYKV